DHPALCKLLGFSDQASSRFPCTQCKIRRNEIARCPEHAVQARCGERHKKRAARYHRIKAQREREKYARYYGVRWSEFCRLPYFNPVEMGVIDPMHALLLG
ncbi:hypothetical protein CALCODRAFT_417649, partial [Calocera cornea HHB12733]